MGQHGRGAGKAKVDVDSTYVSELAETKLAEGSDDFPADLVGDIELDHAHFRRAERGVLFRSHGDVAAGTKTRD